MRRRPAAWACVLALALGGGTLAGCSLGGDDDEKSSGSDSTKTTTTRVEVVEDQGAGSGGFDAQRIFKNEGQGVVTVISLFGGGEPPGHPRRRGRRRRRLRLRPQRGGRDRHQRPRRHPGRGPRGRARADEVYVEFADGNRVEARIVGQDPNADVALLKVDPKGLTLRPLPLGSSADVPVGSPVAAIGSPFGERQSLSIGVVSAIDRDIQSLNGQFAIPGAIQTDAAINPGNSGGPLVNGKGKVIGINQQIKTNSGGGEGVGFAVPVDVVKRSLGRAARDGRGAVRLPRRRLRPHLPAARRALRPAGGQGRVGAGRRARHARGPRGDPRRPRRGPLPDRDLLPGRRHHHRGRGQADRGRERPVGGRRARSSPARRSRSRSTAAARPRTIEVDARRAAALVADQRRLMMAEQVSPRARLQPRAGHLSGGRLGQARDGRPRDRADGPRLPPRRRLDRLGDDAAGRRGHARARRPAVRGRGARGRHLPGALRRVRRGGLRPLLQHRRQPDALVHPALPLGPEQRARHPAPRGRGVRRGLQRRQPGPREGRCSRRSRTRRPRS